MLKTGPLISIILKAQLECIMIFKYFLSGPCNYEYDFIIHNEDAADGNRFILWTMNNAHTKTHVPSAYRTHSTEEMLKPYRNISSVVLKQIYRNYYR